MLAHSLCLQAALPMKAVKRAYGSFLPLPLPPSATPEPGYRWCDDDEGPYILGLSCRCSAAS